MAEVKYHECEDPSVVWPLRFGKVAKQLNVTYKKSSVDWGSIALEILRSANAKAEIKGDEPSTMSTISSSTSSTSETKKSITADDHRRIADIYASLDERNMWKLSTGTYVEKQMEKLALRCNYEHPCHSLILDPECCTWKEYFSAEELREIRMFATPTIKRMPDDLNRYLMSYLGKHTLNELQEHHDTFKYERIQQADHYWIHQTITKALDLYHYNYLADLDRSEADYLRRVWTFIDCCFDASKIKVTR
ncbi:hypothetical protein EC973_003019 [Apophysomyces ossiformis]|uniref:Uncharacterized protein n=1 Tax=Apophysomyces ossiformis TaxID=679940 RepID=A0A8H7BTA2_9FUNG|nr:hypothetical protein EC973_003019 [Apophysomyces ossiformis]